MKKNTIENILFEIEDLNQKLTNLGFQWSDILGLHYSYLMSHCPEGREIYEDGSNPEYYYGPRRLN